MERALEKRLELMVLTDHDSVSGFPEALEAARGSATRVLCGVEINTRESDQVHILGYGISWRDPAFLARLSEFRGRRQERLGRMVERLRGLGMALAMEDVVAVSGETLGRPHVADALKRKGYVSNRHDAFARFLSRGKPAYVSPMGPTPEEAIALIRDAGGFSVLAHPETVSARGAVAGWVAAGLEGIEAHYAQHGPSAIVEFRALAEAHQLLVTGGSDCHGPGTGRDHALGVDLPEADYARLMERLARCKPQA